MIYITIRYSITEYFMPYTIESFLKINEYMIEYIDTVDGKYISRKIYLS